MTTANIIMAVCLIVLMGVAAWLIVRYMRKETEVRFKEQELAQQEEGLKVRQQALDEFNAKLRNKARFQKEWEDSREHIYANFEVLDSEETRPTLKSIQKSLSSKIGYALRNKFPNIHVRHDDEKGGRTVYSVDFYATEYDETV